MKKMILYCLKYVFIGLISMFGLADVWARFYSFPVWYQYLLGIFAFVCMLLCLMCGIEWIFDKCVILFKRLFKKSPSDQEVAE